MSRILTPVLDAMAGDAECQSSEEMQRAVGDANEKTNNGGEDEDEVVLISQDVRALYPSLDIQDITEAVREAMMETKLTFDNVDMKTVGKYLAINMSKKEQKSLNIVSCIPTREGEAEGKCRSVTMAYLDSDFNYKKDKKGKSMKVDKWI